MNLFVCVRVCVCNWAAFLPYKNIWFNITDIFCLHIFFSNPFKSQYGCYNIRLESTETFSIVNLFTSTFGPINGVGVYCKSNKTFASTNNFARIKC